MKSATSALKGSEAEAARARDELRRAQSLHDIAHLSYTRLAEVAAKRPGLVAQQEIDDARSKDLATEAQVAAARSSLEAASQQIQVSRAALGRVKTMLDYARVTAPFDGVITKRYADTGAMIQAGTASDTQSMPVVKLAQWSRLRLVVPVPESAVPDLHLGGTVDVNVPSLNRKFKGRIARFADALSDETRTMHTEIDVENPDGTLVGGMYAETEIELKHPQNALTVPIQALERNGENAKVMVVRPDGTVDPRTVNLGAEGNDRIEVVFVAPSHATREVAKQAAPLIPKNAPIVSATKGIENETLLTASAWSFRVVTSFFSARLQT